MTLRVMDLFSGIGGFSLGLRRAGGFETVAFCEKERFCQQVLAKHWPGVPVFEDVRDLDYDGPVDVITSGDPCQRDSRANNSRDGESMWPYSYAQIRRHRPSYVIRENVDGNIDTGTLNKVEADLAAEGYQVRTYSLEALAFGAAHSRSRTWTLAYTDRAGRGQLDLPTQPSEAEGWKHSMSVGAHGLYWLGSEPPVLRRVDDVPNRLDRIRACGNSVIPAIPELIGRAIMALEAAA